MKDSSGAIARGWNHWIRTGAAPRWWWYRLLALAWYATEKKVAKPRKSSAKARSRVSLGFESTANNANSTSSFLPLLSLGIPSNVMLALIFGALLIQGITPGPRLGSPSIPEVFWGVLASMVVGNLMLLVLALPLVGVVVNLIRVHVGILFSDHRRRHDGGYLQRLEQHLRHVGDAGLRRRRIRDAQDPGTTPARSPSRSCSVRCSNPRYPVGRW